MRRRVILVLGSLFAITLFVASHGYAYFLGWARGGAEVSFDMTVNRVQELNALLVEVSRKPDAYPPTLVKAWRYGLHNGISVIDKGAIPYFERRGHARLAARAREVLQEAQLRQREVEQKLGPLRRKGPERAP